MRTNRTSSWRIVDSALTSQSAPSLLGLTCCASLLAAAAGAHSNLCGPGISPWFEQYQNHITWLQSSWKKVFARVPGPNFKASESTRSQCKSVVRACCRTWRPGSDLGGSCQWALAAGVPVIWEFAVCGLSGSEFARWVTLSPGSVTVQQWLGIRVRQLSESPACSPSHW